MTTHKQSADKRLVARVIGIGVHSVVILVSAAMAAIFGLETLVTSTGLTEVGRLVVLAIGCHVVGLGTFAAYRSRLVWRTALLTVEGTVLGASLAWLAVDFVLAAISTLAAAVFLVASDATREQALRGP
jgi:hypothetical protein